MNTYVNPIPTKYQATPLPEKAWPFKLVAFNEEVCTESRRQFKEEIAPHYKKRYESAAEPAKKQKYGRLEALANALYEGISQNDDGAIRFGFDYVVSLVPSEYLVRGDQLRNRDENSNKANAARVAKTTIRSNINLLIGDLLAIELPEDGSHQHKFRVVYKVKGNIEYGYLLPKH